MNTLIKLFWFLCGWIFLKSISNKKPVTDPKYCHKLPISDTQKTSEVSTLVTETTQRHHVSGGFLGGKGRWT